MNGELSICTQEVNSYAVLFFVVLLFVFLQTHKKGQPDASRRSYQRYAQTNREPLQILLLLLKAPLPTQRNIEGGEGEHDRDWGQ